MNQCVFTIVEISIKNNITKSFLEFDMEKVGNPITYKFSTEEERTKRLGDTIQYLKNKYKHVYNIYNLIMFSKQN